MLRVPLFAVLILSRPLSVLQADDQSWPLDSSTTSKLSVRGDVTATTGVSGNCAVLDGASLLKLKNSEGFTNGETGFTLSAWVNPYLLGGRQQMIAAKNRYSLGERQWGVMIDKDNHFRLYVWQDRWATVDCSRLPKPGHWHLIGVVVRPASAELWVNGKLAGKVKLTKAISRTEAPLTIGGVDDDGRIRQNLVGAIDEVRLFDRPLDAKELTAAYKPIAATHEIPNFASRMNVAANPQAAHLWSDNATLPATADAEVLTDVTFRVIKKWEPDIDGYKWLHGVALAWHKDKLYASFGHNKGRENTVTEEGRYCVSSDDGRTWSDIRTMDVGTESDNLAISHGVFLSRGAELWAFLGAFHNTRQKVHTRAYTLDEQGGQWQPRGVVVDDGFWPMNEPIRMSDGNWIMPGFIAGSGNPAAVVISEGDDLTKWKLVVIPRGEVAGKMWGESSITVDGPRITNIARYGDKPLALAAFSEDFGRTWSPSVESNLPMATSKPCAGILSTGQRYLICTTTADSGGRRSPLTIAVSHHGEDMFSKVFVIRHAEFPAGPGASHPNTSLSYPYATEHAGKLYVAYSNSGDRRGNHNSAELAVIPIASLTAVEGPGASSR